MKRFGRNEIEHFLLAIDKNLNEPFGLLIIGGTAAALAYKVLDYTRDIDTIGSVAKIEEAYHKAKIMTGLDIPLGPAGVHDGPYDFETRLLQHEIIGLKNLVIRVPERHDLVLMKVIRGYEHDLATAKQIHENSPLSLDILIERMTKEMTHITGNKKRTLTNFLALVELLFGEQSVRHAQILLKGWERR